MKAQEFYKTFEGRLKPAMLGLGHSRLKGMASRWSFQAFGGRGFLFFRTSSKYPWEIYSGGRFTLDAFLTDDPSADVQEVEASIEAIIEPLSHLDDATFSQMGQINEKVYRKVAALNRDSMFQQMQSIGASRDDVALLHSSSVESLEWKTGISRAQVNPDLCYYDTEDVLAWAEFFAVHMETITRGIQERPSFAFRKRA